MAYTQTDLDNVQVAILDLANGKRKVSVTVAGQTVEYAQAQLSDLRNLRAEIQHEINVSSGTTSRHTLITSSKGL